MRFDHFGERAIGDHLVCGHRLAKESPEDAAVAPLDAIDPGDRRKNQPKDAVEIELFHAQLFAKLACDLLKETPLASFDDDTPVGRWMSRNFKIIRNMVMSQAPWT